LALVLAALARLASGLGGHAHSGVPGALALLVLLSGAALVGI
jgi:hypothetical protein